jgi:hypothetical protein
MSEYRVLKPADMTPDIRGQILDLGMRSGTWQESDREYYETQLLNPRNTNIVYLNDDNLVTGYILGKPHNEAVLDYTSEDSLMLENKRATTYVDIVITDISQNRVSVGMSLIDKLVQESLERGISLFSLHCRVVNGFSSIIQRKFRKGLKLVRRIEHYIDCNDEPFDYMEIDFM